MSARDVIGGTKYVISSNFETDEDNMLRQEQSYKPYGSSTHSKGPNEGDTAVKLPMPSIPEPPHNQIMFLMPTSISSIPNSATPVFKTAAGVTMVPTSKGPVPIQPMQMPVPSSQITTRSQSSLLNVSDSNAESAPAQTNTPPILRRHPRKPTHPSRSRDASPNPIPMNLYRSIQAPEEDRLSPFDKSSTESEGYITVKTEPHDYNSETCEANLDFDRNLETSVVSPRPCIHVLSHENSADPDRYDKDKVLKSDAAMPQSIEQDRPFDIVIKSEPLDVI